MPSRLSDVLARVRYLVMLKFGCSVNAAAKAAGVPQRTLSRIVNGETAKPNPNVLRKLAEASNVSEGWLTTGRGKGPRQRRTTGGGRAESEWLKLIETLGLDEVRDALMTDLPVGPWVVASLLEPPKATPDFPDFKGVGEFYERPHVIALMNAVYKAWTEYLRVYIAEYGLDELDKKLQGYYVASILALGASRAAEHWMTEGPWGPGGKRNDKTPNQDQALKAFARYVIDTQELWKQYDDDVKAWEREEREERRQKAREQKSRQKRKAKAADRQNERPRAERKRKTGSETSSR